VSVFGRDALPLALAVALLWTLHPLQTEAVTYVIQRVESLMGLCYLLTLYCLIRSVDSPRPALWQGCMVTACLLGMATKEVMATAPLLGLLYDRTFLAGSFREAWQRRRWWYVGLAATWLPLACLVAGTGGNRGGTSGFNVGVAPWAYWLTQFQAVAHYLKLSVWPHPLVFEYGTFWVRPVEALPLRGDRRAAGGSHRDRTVAPAGSGLLGRLVFHYSGSIQHSTRNDSNDG
jgi:hypothetical protein